ncbi:cupin domain-containing protein [Nocardia sp. NPDC101769]|uniref:cupin domain-containing protein n=1 Tax=Nocardia sp. NPDC101769 TaxID=3364333 RepID=UPI00381549B2
MRIEASPEFFHTMISTPANWIEMNPACIGVEHTRAGRLLTGRPAQTGDRVTQYVLVDGSDRVTTSQWEVTASHPGREFAIRDRDAGTHVAWILTEDAGATEAARESSAGPDVDRYALDAAQVLAERTWRELGSVIARDRGTGTLSDYYTETNEQVVGDAETRGAHTAMRVHVHPEASPPLHVHTREDEAWIVLSGAVRFWFGGRTIDTCDTIDVEAGAYVFGPRFVPHTFKTLTDSSELIITNTPGNVEGYFLSIGAGHVRDDAAHQDLFDRYGLVVFTDQLPPH